MSSFNDQPETQPAADETTSGDAPAIEQSQAPVADEPAAQPTDTESQPAAGSADPDAEPAGANEEPAGEVPTAAPFTSETPDTDSPAGSATEGSVDTLNTDALNGAGSESSTLKTDLNLSEPEATEAPASTEDSSQPSTPSLTDGLGGTESDASSPSSGEADQGEGGEDDVHQKPTDEMSAEEMAEFSGTLPSFPMPAAHPNPINPCTGLPLKDEPQSKDSAVVKACDEAGE